MAATPDLSPREKEIFDLLLEGKAPKEIGYDLKISFPTVKFHQKNLYAKLGVQSMRELLLQYKTGYTPPKKTLPLKMIIAAGIAVIVVALTVVLLTVRVKTDGFIPVIDPWYAINDPRSISRIFKTESCITISGTLYNDEIVPRYEGFYAGQGYPFSGAMGRVFGESLAAVRTMRSPSFKVLGDGNFYCIRLPTLETMNGDHWVYVFQSVKDQVMGVHINIPDDLGRLGWSGKDAEFIQENIMFIQIQTVDPDDYKEKGKMKNEKWGIRRENYRYFGKSHEALKMR